MRFICQFSIALSWLVATFAGAEIRALPDAVSQQVFAGANRQISVQFQNPADVSAIADLRVILMQASSATAVRISDTPWKKLSLLPKQTVVESVTLSFPNVKSATRFLVQWVEGMNHVLGTTTVTVYPTNMLTQLNSLAGGGPVGLFDPAKQIEPLLRSLSAEFLDMQEDGTDKYHGKLAIFGPFESKSQLRGSLKKDIQALARRGVAVVWLLPPSDSGAAMKPSFYVVREGEGAVVVASQELIASLAERPESQLNLLQLAQESLRPTALTLPGTETSN